jgi:hypothetical protein
VEELPKAEVGVSIDADALPGPTRDALHPGNTAPPVAAQRSSRLNAAKLESEKVVVSATRGARPASGR